MGNEIRVRVEGEQRVMTNLQAEIEQMGQDVEDVIHTYALKIARDAKRNAPVDTGRLRASITPVLEDLAARVIAGGAIDGAHVDYAAAQEFGTDVMPGKHYMRRALKKHKSDFQRDIRAALS